MNSFRTFICYVVFALTVIAPRAQLFAAAMAEKPQEGRYLFLVETSAATDNDRTAIRKSIRNILESGLGGHMQYGDTIGLWTYGEKANTDFPMAMWTHEHLSDVENAIDFWMTKQKFKGHAVFTPLQAPLQKVIKGSQKLTIIWISSGDNQITGTPFDKEIAELHKEFAPNFRKQNIPFVTLLAVRKGAVVDFTVNPGDSTIRLPDVFDKEDAAAAATNTPPVETAPVAKKPPLIIRVGPSPELLAKKANAAQVTNAPATTPTNSLAATNSASQPSATNASVIAQPPVQSNAPAVTNTPAPVVAKPQAVVLTPVQSNVAAAVTNVISVPATNAPAAVVANTNSALTTAAPTNNHTNTTAAVAPVAQKSKAPIATPSRPTPVATAVAPAPNYMLYMVYALGPILVLVAGVAVYLAKKSRAKGPSFISQSMTRERFSSDASKPSSDKPSAPE